MGCKKNLKKVLSFALAFLLGLVVATILQNKNISPKTQEKVKTITKTIYQGQGSGSSGYSDRETKSYFDFTPRSSENFSSEIKPIKIISKPRPYYTDLARQNNVQGNVKLRVAFLASGEIGSISPIGELPSGLTEQAIIAAKLIKFEPALKLGKVITVTKIVQYDFTIY